jgi:hypothetical protein
VFNRTALYNLSQGISGNGLGTTAYSGFVVPDLVGNIRVDQAWGLFQVSAALHDVSGTYNTVGAFNTPAATNILSGHPDAKVGGSVMAALQIKNIPTGAGDDIKMDASWAVGDTKQVISTSAASPSFFMMGGTKGQFGPNNTVGIGATTDGVYLPTANGGDGQIHLTTSYGFRGAFNHNWDPYWSTSLFGGVGVVKYDSTANAEFCAVLTAGHAGLTSCNMNYTASMVGTVTRWTPVKNLTFSAEFLYFQLHQNIVGSAVFNPGGPQPTMAYTFHDQSTASLNVRVQRNF